MREVECSGDATAHDNNIPECSAHGSISWLKVENILQLHPEAHSGCRVLSFLCRHPERSIVIPVKTTINLILHPQVQTI